MSCQVTIEKGAKSINLKIMAKISLRHNDRVARTEHQKEVVSILGIRPEAAPADCHIRSVRVRFEAIFEESQARFLVSPGCSAKRLPSRRRFTSQIAGINMR